MKKIISKSSRIAFYVCLLAAMLLTLLCACAGESADTLADGTYEADVVLEGGTGRATVESPASVTVKDGAVTATIVWSSSHYDYMLVGGEKYLNEAEYGEASTFSIPVSNLDEPLEVVGDTTAMSVPHEIEYTLRFELRK